jgi:hypothetical protein
VAPGAASLPFCRSRQPNDQAATLAHFCTKLLGLVHAMHAEAGRKEARVRTDFMFAYLAQLESEITSNQLIEAACQEKILPLCLLGGVLDAVASLLSAVLPVVGLTRFFKMVTACEAAPTS